jgi:hypothetical protein
MTNLTTDLFDAHVVAFRREGLIGYLWDAYKDLYGSRPRWYNFKDATLEELLADADRVSNQISEECRLEREADEAAVELVVKSGASDEATAKRWLADAEDHYYYWYGETRDILPEAEPLPYEFAEACV